MIGELLQLSRENDELRKEIDALKAELESLKADFALDREMFLNEHDENVRLHTALEQEREKSERLRGALEDAADGLQNAWEDLGNCEEERCVPSIGEVSSCRAYLDDARQALLAAKDEGDV